MMFHDRVNFLLPQDIAYIGEGILALHIASPCAKKTSRLNTMKSNLIFHAKSLLHKHL